MEVAGTRNDQTEIGAEPAQLGSLFGEMVGMLGLDARETCPGEGRDVVGADSGTAPRGVRVGENAHAAGGGDQLDGLGGIELVPRNPVPSARADPIGRERLVEISDEPDLDERGGDMRASDRTAAGEPVHQLTGHRMTIRLQLVDDLLGADVASLAKPAPRGRELRFMRIKEVREQMQADRAARGRHPAGQLAARHERQARRQCGTRPVPTGRGVVIGRASTSSPASAAARTSSPGSRVPSEAVEWVCRSMRKVLLRETSSYEAVVVFAVPARHPATSRRPCGEVCP